LLFGQSRKVSYVHTQIAVVFDVFRRDAVLAEPEYPDDGELGRLGSCLYHELDPVQLLCCRSLLNRNITV